MPEYGTHERAALFVLALEGRPIPNSELVRDHKIELRPKLREHLNDKKLIETTQDGRKFTHVITRAGVEWVQQELIDVETPPRSGPLARVMFDMLRKVFTYLRRQNIELIDILHPADLEAMIRSVYRELSETPEDLVRLARLRPKLDGASRTEVDQALVAMVKAGGVHLVPDSNRKALTADDHAAAIRVGSEDKHLLTIEAS